MATADPDFRHPTPDDIRAALDRNATLAEKWAGLTDLGRNEWICWTISVKTEETRAKHVARLEEDVLAGKQRPCCWPGCPHRRPSAQKYVRS